MKNDPLFPDDRRDVANVECEECGAVYVVEDDGDYTCPNCGNDPSEGTTDAD